jgi:hypothetical protein
MSRSSFFSRSSSSADRNPLLPTHHTTTHDSISLQNLSPDREPHSRPASPSPPPSFYRSKNDAANRQTNSASHPYSDNKDSIASGSLDGPLIDRYHSGHGNSALPTGRRIQFAAPPPPVAMRVGLPAKHRDSEHGRERNKIEVRRNVHNQFLLLERRERSIQAELQTYLDAQSEGLIQGLDRESLPGRSSLGGSDAGSSTPTSHSVRNHSLNSSGAIPIRQPKQKRTGLRGARRGLLRGVSELVMVKEDQLLIISDEIARRKDALSQLSIWEKRILAAETEFKRGNSQDETRELEQLRDEETAVEHEIAELEERLMQMKARKKWLGDRIKERVNREESRLSSWRGAIRESEREVRGFLKRPPVETSTVLGGEEGFLSLPPARRTLAMARECWEKEIAQLSSKNEDVEVERQALEEGAGLWQDVVDVVNNFEDELKRDMSSTGGHDVEALQGHVTKMGSAIERLASAAQTAEDNKWNLLICAIGAELEAFKEGKKILQRASGIIFHEESATKEDLGSTNGVGVDGSDHKSENGPTTSNNGSPGLDMRVEADESEDEGPNLAELLIEGSH